MAHRDYNRVVEGLERSDGTAAEAPREPARRTGVERSVEVQLGTLGGVELRPTRVFLWGGASRSGQQIVSFGTAPKNLRSPRRERDLQAGALHVRSLGNPLMTMALAGVHVARRIARDRNSGSASTT